MVSVLDTIFQPNLSTVDGTCQALDVIGISKAIQLVLFPKEAG
jgi:hypothetical protein